MSKPFFSKLTALALAALMMLSTASCAVSKDDGESTTGATTTAGSADTAATGSETTAGTTAGTTADTDAPAGSTSGNETTSTDETAGSGETAAETSAATQPETEDETVDSDYVCDLPDDLNYNGTEVNILYVNVAGREDELVSEKLGSGAISDSVFERNLKLESQLGVELFFVDQDSDTAAQGVINNLVKGNDDSIGIFTLGTYCAISPALNGCYHNLSAIEPVDLDKHYWSQDYNEVFTFTSDSKRFFSTSPAALSLFRLTYLTIFNRDLFADRNLPNLYEVVENGEWTLDYQASLISDVWTDLDGDGKASEKDFFGLITGNCISADAYCVAADIHMVVRDEDGYLAFNKEDSDRMIDMSEKVSSIYNSKGTYFFRDQTYDDIGKHFINEKFASEEGLMATTQFLGIEHNIDALNAFNYGIVPMPKLNTLQEKYMTYVQDQVSAFGISSAIGDEEDIYMLGALMEAMAYYSNEIVRPAYYDSALSLRFMQDPDSRAILDTMFETISFDYCYATGFGDIRGELRTRLSSKDPAMASRVTVWERSFARKLERENAALDKLP